MASKHIMNFGVHAQPSGSAAGHSEWAGSRLVALPDSPIPDCSKGRAGVGRFYSWSFLAEVFITELPKVIPAWENLKQCSFVINEISHSFCSR